MEEEMLLANVSGSLFIDPDETDIPDMAIATSSNASKEPSFDIASLTGDEPSDPEDDELNIGLSANDINKLTALRDTLVETSDSESVSESVKILIDETIAENSSNGSSSDVKVASQLNGVVPEEGVGDDDDDDDDDDDGGGVKVGTDDDDLIVGTTADESMYGKRGEDTLRGNEGKDTIYSGKDDDDCEGGDDDDDVRGDQGKDTCKGGQGNDTLHGGKGNDTLYGGKGNDTCNGDDDDDWENGNEGDDKVDGDGGKDTLYGGKGNDTCNGGADKDTISGDKGDDTCDGGDDDDSVGGGTGNDTLHGGGGNDTCSGDDGDDSVGGGGGDDTLVGGGGNDTCSGDDGDDSVGGGGGDDTLVGGGGNDTCSGDDGDDSVGGGGGDDTLVGGGGNDTCSGDDGDDSVVGGGGDDTVVGGGGNDTCVAGDGNDMTDGGDGDDSVVGGGGGDDTLMGGNGNDTIVGGTGNHTCVGGAGGDIFVVGGNTSPGGSSVITDFTNNLDKFLLTGSLSFSSFSFIQVGVNVEIRSNSLLLAILLNISATLLDASDFIGSGGSGNIPGNNNTTPTPTSPTPTNTPPQEQANKTLSLGGGTTKTITSDDLRYFDAEQGFSGTLFTVTNLPPATAGQLFVKGVAVTQAGVTFTQTDITLGLVTFKAVAAFSGATSFGFTVSDGTNVVVGKSFNLNVIQTTFNFAGSTTPQNIVGSDFDDNIEGGDAADTITGGKSNDTIKGGKGADTLKGDDGDDDMDGGDDDDSIEGGIGDDTIKGGKGKETLKGGEGKDDIDGGDDDDDADGGTGDDTLKGGIGNDKLTGNDGSDCLEGSEGTNTLKGGQGNDRFVYNASRDKSITVADADLIEDFSVDDDVLEFSAAAFANLSVASLTKLSITASSTVGSIGSANLLDFSADITVTSIATLQARFLALGGNSEQPTFCQFTDGATGRTVLVFSVGLRFEAIASFSLKISLEIKNFVFTGPPLNVPVATSGPDNLNFGTFPSGVNFKALGGNDTIVGSNFNDTIDGGDGNDILTGSGGLDVLTGGSGADIFAYRTTKEGGDRITDFQSGTDKFQFVSSEFGKLSSANFDAVSGSAPDITDKELVIFTGGTFASLEAAQAKATGNSSSPAFFVYKNAANETVLAFDSNGTIAGGITKVANLGTAATSLGTADFIFTGSIGTPITPPPGNSIVDLTAPGNTFPLVSNNFGSGAGGYNFTTPVLFTGNDGANNVTGTQFADFLTGGGSADILTGGSGADIFAYKTPGEGGDTITDFTFGVDKLQFAGGAFGNLTTTNFDVVSGSAPDITGKELVIFTGGTYASVADAQTKALGNSTSAGFFAFTNAANETVLVFDSNGTATGGFTTVANLGTAAGTLGTADFIFTGSITTPPGGTTPNSGSIVDLTAPGNTFVGPTNNFGSGAGGYNFTTPVLFTGDDTANSVTGTEFADILSGGSGADNLTGGAGADIFGYKAPGEGGDTITDFTSGVDKFQFVSGAFGNFTTTNFDAVSGSSPDITGKELVIFTGGTFATLADAQASAIGNSTSPAFFVYTNAANETVLAFDSNGTAPNGFTKVANLGTAVSTLGTADFVFTGSVPTSPGGTTPNSGSIVDLTAPGNTFPPVSNNFGSGAGGYNFTSPVLFTGDTNDNNVTATQFADFMTGSGGNDIFDGGLGNDSISGDDGNDSLFGGGDSDTINGGNGNDTLIGGLGTNVLNGGDGVDVFVFSGTSAGGGDLITNYSTADDVINLDKTGFAAFQTGSGLLGSSFYAYSSIVSVTALEATLTSPSIMALFDGASTKLYYDSNGSTVGGSSLFATVDVNLGVSGNSELFLF
jgi:Ca2+-binding RTX toxin-like protein